MAAAHCAIVAADARRRGDRIEDYHLLQCIAVRYWHSADIALAPADVRFRG